MEWVALMLLRCVFAASEEKITLRFLDNAEREYDMARRIFTVSETLIGCIDNREKMKGEKGAFPFTQGIFDTLVWMLEDGVGKIPDMDACPLYSLIHAWDFLGLPRGNLHRIYRRLMEKGLRGRHLEKILEAKMEEEKGLDPFFEFTLSFLRMYARM